MEQGVWPVVQNKLGDRLLIRVGLAYSEIFKSFDNFSSWCIVDVSWVWIIDALRVCDKSFASGWF
jgi:hypothetical protein